MIQMLESKEQKPNQFALVPQEMKSLPNWVLWRLEERDGKSTKVPYTTTGKLASTVDPETWTTFDLALTACGNYSGIGWAIIPPYVGVDFDKCRDPKTGTIQQWAIDAIKGLDSYTELSPSGAGFHIIVKGEIPPGGNRRGAVEMYTSGRYFTVTGEHLGWTPLAVNQRDLAAFHTKYLLNGNGSNTSTSGKRDESPSGKEWALVCQIVRDLGPDATEADITMEFFRRAKERPKWTENKNYVSRTAKNALEKVGRENGGGAPALIEVAPERAEYHPTELGNAERLVGAHGDDIRYCYPRRKWFIWNGKVWEQDDKGRILDFAENVIRNLYLEAARATDPNQSAALAKWGARSESKHVLQASVDLAQHMVAVLPDEFDRDVYLLNVDNGTLNLRTGKLQEHRREDMPAKFAPVMFNPSASCPLWNKFLAEVLPDEATRKFVQRAVGYSLTGFAGEHCFFIPYGTGRNGKTTFLKTLQHVLGNYALQSDWQSFTISKGGGIQIRNDIARLQGARLVCAVEGEQNKRLAESLVKALTGGDRMAARFLYQEYVEFEPQCKFWLATNHKPKIVGTDEAIWSRIHLVPFTVTIPPERRDPQLVDKLKTEASGILNWALEGLRDYQANGLRPSAQAAQATAEYRAESDVIQHFLDARCAIDKKAQAKARDLYRDYKLWAEEVSEYIMSQRDFKKALEERGFESRHTEYGWAWHGLGLNTADGADGSKLNFF